MRRRIQILLIACLLLSLSPRVFAQQPLDPRVKTLFDEVIAAYRKLNRYHEKFVYTTGNDPVLVMESVEFRFQRPNRFSLRRQYRNPSVSTASNAPDAVRSQWFISDSAEYGWWTPERNAFFKAKLPSNLADIPDLPMVSPTIIMLIRNEDPFTPFAQQGGFSLGKPEKLGELDVDVIEFTTTSPETNAVGKGKILVGQKDRLLRKMTYDVTDKDPMTGKEVVKTSEILWQIVNPAPTFAPTEFKFIVPAVKAPSYSPSGSRPPGDSRGASPKQKSGKPK
jgi:outer membrane lipoprotein-sorting protein